MLRPATFITDELPVETTAGQFYPVISTLDIEIPRYPTIYMTLRNPTTEYADIVISCSMNGEDVLTKTSFSMEPDEVVTVPVPTAYASECKLFSSQRVYLLKIEQESTRQPTEGYYPFTVNYSDSIQRNFASNGVNATMVAGSSIQIAMTAPAEAYILHLNASRPIHLVRGRVTYKLVGEVTFILSAKSTQDVQLVAEQLTSIRLKIGAARPLVAQHDKSIAFIITV